MIIINILAWEEQANDCELSLQSLLALADHYGLTYEAEELLSQGLDPWEVAQELDLF